MGIEWCARVKRKNHSTFDEFRSWQILDVRINDNGDLRIVRTMPDMYVEPTVAAYASGEWELVDVEREGSDGS